MSFDLRAYQDELYAQAKAAVASRVRRVLIQSPTGSGKTVLIAKMLHTAASKGHRAWFNVHRRELVKQSLLTLSRAGDLSPGVCAASFPPNRGALVQVCMVSTLRKRRVLLPDPSLIVWDEAHHSAAATWDEIHAAYPKAIHIGLSATPERLDGRGLSKYFDKLIVGPSVAWLIEQGFLSSYKLFAPTIPDLGGVHSVAGDFNKKELSAAMAKSTVTGDVITHYKRLASGKRMVLFAWSVESSKALAEQFNAAGIRAEHVDGDTDPTTRDGAMERFISGETLVLTNVDLFGEGVDVPAIEAVALLRPTQSLSLYLQQVGRALRPAPGKEHAIILDHAGNCRRFGLPDDEREWTLEGRKKGRASSDAVPIRQCARCFAVMPAAADKCGHCGFVFDVQSREIERVEGELSEVDLKALQREQSRREQSDATTLDDLTALARRRGYKNPEKWAHHIYASRQAKQAAREARGWMARGAPMFDKEPF
jgi:DNA repair protein RadD